MNCAICGVELNNQLDTWGYGYMTLCFDCHWDLCEDRPSEIEAMYVESDFGDLQRQEWEQRGI